MLKNGAVILLLGLLLVSITIEPAVAATSSYPEYIKQVYPWKYSGTNTYSEKGVSILLTYSGGSAALYWDGAYALAYFTISDYERITGKKWPYNLRSRESIAREIQFHARFTLTSVSTIDMGFGENYW
ncbi:hypothetical protein KKB43_06610 [Patescibacteria group bacterium]|nr:hypothetical protein [Patescibacteria group bacterium]MBU4580651.1 hypothetical protein [Patescibacteria group bacterium]